MGLGLGGVGHVNVLLHLRHEVDDKLMLRYGWGWGWVGWGMSTFACTCVMKLMLRGWVKIHTGGIDSCWAILKAGVPDKIASKCGSKPNPLLWKYIRSAQWCWEMNSADLLAKTGLYLAKLWAEKRKTELGTFLTTKCWKGWRKHLAMNFFKKLFWTQNVRLPSTRTPFLRNHGTVKDPSG